MPCQDAALDALVAFMDENDGDPASLLHLKTCVSAGALPTDCSMAAGVDVALGMPLVAPLLDLDDFVPLVDPGEFAPIIGDAEDFTEILPVVLK